MAQSANTDWMNPWQELSRNYATAWQNLSRGQAPQAPANPATPWHEGFEQWSRLFSAGSGAQGETIERIIDSAKGYAAFMQSALTGMPGSTFGQPPAAAAWGDLMRPFYGAPTADAGAFENPFMRAWRERPDLGGNAFAQIFGGMNAMRGMPAAPSGDLGELKAWLSLPAFGVARERQEHYQKMAVGWVEYQEQMQRYNALMLKATQRGFQVFEGKLSEREQPGRQIDSLRALYDLWVDAAEEGYAEIALSVEFREVYGALVNAQMRARAQMQQEIERICVDLGMPTRSEIDTLGERVQALRREMRARGAADGDTKLGAEVASLRREVSALRSARSATSPAADTSVAAAAPKPAAPKPAAPKSAASKAAARKPAARKRAAAASRDPAPPAVSAKSAPAAPKRKRKAAAPVLVKKKSRRKAARRAERAVAAVATGNFSSRIAKFATASLGKPHKPKLVADADTDAGNRKRKKKR